MSMTQKRSRTEYQEIPKVTESIEERREFEDEIELEVKPLRFHLSLQNRLISPPMRIKTKTCQVRHWSVLLMIRSPHHHPRSWDLIACRGPTQFLPLSLHQVLRLLKLNPNSKEFIPPAILNSSRNFNETERSVKNNLFGVDLKNFSKEVIQVNRENLSDLLRSLIYDLENAYCIGIDFEFSGLKPPAYALAKNPYQLDDNFSIISRGIYEFLYKPVHVGLSIVLLNLSEVRNYSVYIYEGDPNDIHWNEDALQVLLRAGFDIEKHKETCIDSRSFLELIYPYLETKFILFHYGFADLLHLIRLGKNIRFNTEEEFKEFLSPPSPASRGLRFYDTKRLAKFEAGMKSTILGDLAKQLCGADFESNQMHDASFDAFLTVLVWFKLSQMLPLNDPSLMNKYYSE